MGQAGDPELDSLLVSSPAFLADGLDRDLVPPGDPQPDSKPGTRPSLPAGGPGWIATERSARAHGGNTLRKVLYEQRETLESGSSSVTSGVLTRAMRLPASSHSNAKPRRTASGHFPEAGALSDPTGELAQDRYKLDQAAFTLLRSPGTLPQTERAGSLLPGPAATDWPGKSERTGEAASWDS